MEKVKSTRLVSNAETSVIAEPETVLFGSVLGYEAQVRPRSGLSIKQGLTLVNCTGTVDSDYRGEIKVPMINLSTQTQIIKNGDRIAQMVIMPIAIADIKIVDELSETSRGEGGFARGREG